jgi:UDP-3-O-[3-hydroxymyristoyl] glucosamine N-acyltransferase
MNRTSLTLAELAKMTQSDIVGDPHYVIYNVADLNSATSEDASFLNKLPYGQTSRYEVAMRNSHAGVIFVHSETALVKGRNYLLNENPSRAFQQALEALRNTHQGWTSFTGIHPTSVIHEEAKISQDVSIGPYVVIEAGAIIGERTTITAGCYIGQRTQIGSDCLLHPHTVIREDCLIGNRVIIQPGAVIGSCGFGYTTDKEGHHHRLNQLGKIVIEDDVEIGANTTIDRSRFQITRIGRGTKIDNLVQIGHGVLVGPDNMIVAQAGIAGSSETGRHVVLAGQTAVAGHIKLGDGVILTACSGASKSMPKAGKYGGAPAMPLSEYNHMSVHLRNIEKYVEKIKDLEERLKALEQ